MLLFLILGCEEPCDSATIDGPTGTEASVHICPCDEGPCYAAEGFEATDTFVSGRLVPGCYVVAMEWELEDGGQFCAMAWMSEPIDVTCGEQRTLVWEDGDSTSVCRNTGE